MCVCSQYWKLIGCFDNLANAIIGLGASNSNGIGSMVFNAFPLARATFKPLCLFLIPQSQRNPQEAGPCPESWHYLLISTGIKVVQRSQADLVLSVSLKLLWRLWMGFACQNPNSAQLSPSDTIDIYKRSNNHKPFMRSYHSMLVKCPTYILSSCLYSVMSVISSCCWVRHCVVSTYDKIWCGRYKCMS